MTTIVFKDGIIAWDSRITTGDTIAWDTAEKRHKAGGRTFWTAGTVGDVPAFMAAYEGRQAPRDLDVVAFVLDLDGRLYVSSVEDEGRIWTSEVKYPRAIGSGANFALAAMDCGKDALGALKIAVGRDTNTGGKLRKQKIL